MALFTIKAPDGRKIKIKAADEATAVRGAKEWVAANPSAGTTAMASASKASQQLQGKVSDLPSQRPSFGDEVMSFGRGVIEGIPVAGPMLADWRRGLDANIGSLFQGRSADELKAEYEAEDQELASKTGGARMAGNVSGAVASLAPLGATALGGRLLGMQGGLLSRVGMGAASGSAISAADTVARGGDMNDALGSAGIGAALGGVLPAVGGALRNTMQKAAQTKATSAAIKGAPDVSDLKATASALFENSRAAGAGVNSQKFASFAADLVTKAKAADIDDVLDGEALAAYRRMATMAQEAMTSGQGVSLSRLHNLRQLAQDVAISATKDRTKRFAGQIVTGLDDMIGTLKPADMTGAGGTQAANDLMEGISTWSRAKKLSLLEEAITKSGFQKSGVENGLRLQFLAILRDPAKRKLFTAPELAEIEKVAKGTAVSNIATLLGKFGFGLGNNGNNVVGGSLGMMLGGPLGMAVGAASRKGAEMLAVKGAERAAKVVATPNIPILPRLPAPNAMLAPAVLPLTATRR